MRPLRGQQGRDRLNATTLACSSQIGNDKRSSTFLRLAQRTVRILANPCAVTASNDEETNCFAALYEPTRMVSFFAAHSAGHGLLTSDNLCITS